nr:MAG TPA_asm: hypothetical protein [Caudoviricetes sp.]
MLFLRMVACESSHPSFRRISYKLLYIFELFNSLF